MSTRSLALHAAFEADVAHIRGNAYKDFSIEYALANIVRKFKPSDNEAIPIHEKTFATFLHHNARCSRLDSVRVGTDRRAKWEIDRELIGEVRKIIDDFCHPNGMPFVSSYYDLLKDFRTGPGSNYGAIGSSFYTKYFSSPLTCTNNFLANTYLRYVEWFHSLEQAEQARSQNYGAPRIVEGSKMTFVPKTDSASRSICVEPSLNMIYQLGLGSFLEEGLKRSFGIFLSTQQGTNRAYAMQGSHDDSISTIDLTAASDCISIGLIKELFPKWFFDIVATIRSPKCFYNGEWIELKMISTMGNGFTFPLQTVIFAAIATACKRIFGKKFDSVGVFGDDIIVKSDYAHHCLRLLRLFGFKPNAKKVFLTGPFRESCGGDYFRGRNCRPPFIKELSTEQDITVAINLLNRWSANTGVFLPNSVGYLFSLLRRRPLWVPFSENMDAGVHVPSTFLTALTLDDNGTPLYRRYLSRPSVIRCNHEDIIAPRKLRRKIIFNPYGLYVSFLRGDVANGKISVRHDRTLYVTNVARVPWWDFEPPHSQDQAGWSFAWHTWETCVLLNCGNP